MSLKSELKLKNKVIDIKTGGHLMFWDAFWFESFLWYDILPVLTVKVITPQHIMFCCTIQQDVDFQFTRRVKSMTGAWNCVTGSLWKDHLLMLVQQTQLSWIVISFLSPHLLDMVEEKTWLHWIALSFLSSLFATDFWISRTSLLKIHFTLQQKCICIPKI